MSFVNPSRRPSSPLNIMAIQSPCIPAFFSPSHPECPPPSTSSSSTKPTLQIPALPSHALSSVCKHSDGFTAEEINAALHPPSAQWIPQRDYGEVDIGMLQPGPQSITFTGRIVNLYDKPGKNKAQAAAKGMLKLMVGDDTGAVTVRLYYADMVYRVRLGILVTVWTIHVSNGEPASLAPSAAPLFTTIFPERERSCYIMLHENSDDGKMCKWPYGCKGSQAMIGLMTLKNFVEGGYDVKDGKVLVCVKSIGARKKCTSVPYYAFSYLTNRVVVTSKAGYSSELISIGVFDDTAEAQLTLYSTVCSSAAFWQPSHTVLLISQPGWRIDRKMQLSLSANTRVDIDPETSDALWLRDLAQRLTKREDVNPPFPDGVFDTIAVQSAAIRILYTLADIDIFARTNPKERFMGYISVIITELHIVSNYKRNMLMCTECCGIPLYANAVKAKCRQCDRPCYLRINPKIIGPVIDETGQIANGKIVFSDAAWEQLLGRNTEELVKLDLEQLTYLEHRLVFMRVSLGFGWCLEGTVPNDEEVFNDELEEEEMTGKLRGRKRRRLDVLKRSDKEKAHAAEQKSTSSIRDETEGNSKQTRILASVKEDVASISDSESQVGRLCIWCVKM